MPVNSNDPAVSAAIAAVAKSMGVTEGEALKILVAKGAQQIANSSGARGMVNSSSIHFQKSQPSLATHEASHASHILQQSTLKIKGQQ